MIPDASLSLESLFAAGRDAPRVATCWRASRNRGSSSGLDLVLDVLAHDHACCLSLRAVGPGTLRLAVVGFAGLEKLAAGGWLISLGGAATRHYWLPVAPRLHRFERQGRMLADRDVEPADFGLEHGQLEVAYDVPSDSVLDCVIWELPPAIAAELRALEPLEGQGCFLWGSHTVFKRPADLYRHLVHGLVYEDRYEWPKRWRICSENDAHALYVVCSGLGRATGKRLYALLKTQLLLAVLERQGGDGGYRHGTWTDDFEAHYRLHASAMHMFMDALDEKPDDALRNALDRAVAFAASQVDDTSLGSWFLHDELEKSAAALDRGPFRWIPSTVFGKSPSNMLVLNTHLDLLVALDRHAELTATSRHAALIESARKAALTVLALAPASGLYALVCRCVDLTVLPTPSAARLPLPWRAVKRLAREYLVPRLPDVKTRYPRLVMPNGYVDRALSIRNWSHRYLGINAMDLARAGGRFPSDTAFVITARNALRYALRSGLAERWREQSADHYAIGFLTEAYCRMCALDADMDWRAGLATQLLAMEELRLGFPPTLLGCNGEATPWRSQVPCPSPATSRLRVATLSSPWGPEYLVLNVGRSAVTPDWLRPPPAALTWMNPDGSAVDADAPLEPGAWRLARATLSAAHEVDDATTTTAPTR